MTTPQESIIVDSCQYTPVYLIQNPGAIQGRSYVVTQNHIEEPKPVSDNLKRFYESSGLLENNLVNNVGNVTKPRILKKAEPKTVGNNLKLASFLLPKIENTPRQYIAVNNVVLKSAPAPAPPPAPSPASTVINTTVPRVEVDRKIVKMKNIPTRVRATPERVVQIYPERIVKTNTPECTLPKTRPKENIPSPKQTKHTSVQLLKLGETYHSLNQLNDEQMKMVNQALKIFSNPEAPTEPTYDPITNTRFIYKVVSPRDLTVVGKNKLVVKNNKKEKKETEKEPETPLDEVKVTRSGRKVKFPKQMISEDLHKPRKKRGTVVSCFQCSAEFCNLFRLQKHYESHPTHIPAKIHSNLFHCLLAIIKSGSEEDRANMFIQQLEQLIEKLKSLLPCLLKKIDGTEGNPCYIKDDIAKLFGMNPGKYNLNMDALACIKDKDGYCCHNPPPKLDLTNPSPLWLVKDEAAKDENEDCARINAVDKWPTASKRLWKIKKNKENIKRMRLVSENTENAVIELGVEDLITFADKNDNANELPDLSAINISKQTINIPKSTINIPKPTINISKPAVNIPKPIINITQPAANIPKPTINITQPAANIPKPTINITQPAVNIPKPTINITRPAVNIPKPIINITQPSLDITQPTINITQSAINISQTTTSISQPSLKIAQPVINISQPVKIEPSMPIIPTEIIDDDVDDTISSIVEQKNGIHRGKDIKQSKLPHLQFHSTHFDIRSSPIKPSAAVFCKFQINSEKIARFEARTIRPLDLDKEANIQQNTSLPDPMHTNHIDSLHTNHIDPLHSNHIQSGPIQVNHIQSDHIHENHIPDLNHIQSDIMHSDVDSVDLQSILQDEMINLSCKDVNVSHDLSFDAAKDFFMNSDSEKSSDTFMKSNGLIEPSLIHVKDTVDKLPLNEIDHSLGSDSDSRLLNQGQSVLNFLDSLGSDCLSYPETDIRNTNVDFQLDLFSFHNS